MLNILKFYSTVLVLKLLLYLFCMMIAAIDQLTSQFGVLLAK